MIQDPLTFAKASFLWLLLALPFFVLLRVLSQTKSGSVLNAFTAPRLRHALVTGANPVFGWVVFGLQLAALGLFILALAQPRWGQEDIERIEGGRDVIIAIDTSRSMLANDISPDRLTRATLAAQDLLNVLPGDRVGLIAFSGHAYLQAPLTTDHDAVAESIQSLDFLAVPKGGSVLSEALDLAIKTFEKSPARTHGLILFSDGGDPEPQLASMVERALENQILVLTVGVGTEGGSLIPNPDPNARGDYVRDDDGNVVQTKLDSAVLRELATATRGAYFQLGTRSLAAAGIAQVLNQLDMQLLASTETTRPIERFQWPLATGMFLLMIAWMLRPRKARHAAFPGAARPVRSAVSPAAATVTLVALSLLASAPNADAGTFFGLRIPFLGSSDPAAPAKEAIQSFESGDFEKSRELYNELLQRPLPTSRRTSYAYGLGTASRATEKFDEAVDAFSDVLKEDVPDLHLKAHQGLAHTLYDQGEHAMLKQAEITIKKQNADKSVETQKFRRVAQFTIRAWQDSIKHFDAALAITPDDEKIRENRDFVQKRLDELQSLTEQQQQQQQQQQGGEGNEGEPQEGQEGEDEGEGQSGKQPGEQSGDGKGQQNNDGGGDEEGEQKESIAKEGNEKQKGPLPEGEIQAASDSGGKEPGEEEGVGAGDGDERDDETGFSANEARSFLRTYADDQKGVQLRQQREPPAKGQDW